MNIMIFVTDLKTNLLVNDHGSINCDQEENGIKPRWIDFSLLTTDQINAMIDDLHDSAVYMQELDKSDRDEWIRNEQIESELQPTRYDLMAYNHGY